MVNFSELASSLQSANVGVVLKALGELRERIEIVHTSDFSVFLQKIFPILRDLVLTRLNPQFTDNAENKCRQIILEIFNRFPNSDVLKPCVFDMLKLSLKVLVVDNEENSLTALRIIFDLHKSFRPSLENQVQPFLEIVQKILKNIPISARTMFTPPPKLPVQSPPLLKQPSIPGGAPGGANTNSHAAHSGSNSNSGINHTLSSSHSAPSLSSMGGSGSSSGEVTAPKAIPKPGSTSTPFLKSVDSFKVLTECPLIIMLLFQVYSNFIQKNIPQMLPLMMNVLGLQFSASNFSPALRVRFREFVASQVKILSLITYFLRGFTELMRPYEDTIANNVLVLIRFCPQESVSTRKELLVDFRHILATDFRKGFYKHLDFFIDETFLMGPGQQAYETLRPLAFSTIADLVHHSREYLSFAQLSKVVFLFAKSIHDVQLPVIIQTTSVRILMNISEKFATTVYKDSDSFQRDRKLLSRILRTLILKFDIINRQLEGTGGGGGESALSCGGEDYGTPSSIFSKLQTDLLTGAKPVQTVTEEGEGDKEEKEEDTGSDVNSISGSVVNEGVFSSSINLASDSMKDVKSLIKNLLLALKVVLVSISAMQKSASSTNQPGGSSTNSSSGNSSSTGTTNISMYVMADDEVDHMKLFLKWALKSIDGVCQAPSSATPFTETTSHTSNNQKKSAGSQQPLSNQNNFSSPASLAASNYETDQEVKDLLEPMISVFAILQPLCLIRSILGENMEYIVELAHARPIFISLLHQLLMSTSTACSQLTMDTLLTFIVTKLPELSNKSGDFSNEKEDHVPSKHTNYSSTLLKIFKVSLGIISLHPENEKVLRPRLCSIIHICLRLASESKYTLNYILVIRTLFRSISGGKFEHAYKEMNIVLPTLLKGFGHLLHRSKHIETQNAILELSLTIPCRLDTMLLHFPFLLEMFCRAVTAKKSDSLPNLALRTLEFWTDNLKPDYLFSLMSSKPDLLHRIFTGICLHLKPPPYPYGSLAARVLGKFGGKNTRFLRNFFPPEFAGSGAQHLVGAQSPPVHTMQGGGNPTFFSVKLPNIFVNGPEGVGKGRCGAGAVVVSIDASVESACSILNDLVPSYAVKEIEILSVINPSSDNASVSTNDVKQSKTLQIDQQDLADAIDKILLCRRERPVSSFQPRDEAGEGEGFDEGKPLSSFSIDLYNRISAETVVVVQSVIDSQVENAFHLLKCTLLQVLPALPLPSGVFSGDRGEDIEKDLVFLFRKELQAEKNKEKRKGGQTQIQDAFTVFDSITQDDDIHYDAGDNGDSYTTSCRNSDLFQNLLTRMLYSLICSTIFPQLRAECAVSSFLEGLCYHVALLDAVAHQWSEEKRGGYIYQPIVFSCALNEAIMQCLVETRTDVFQAGAKILQQWLAAVSAVSQLVASSHASACDEDPNSDFVYLPLPLPSLLHAPGLTSDQDLSCTPAEYFICHAVDLCSSSSLWVERMAGVRAIHELCKCLSPVTLRGYDREIIEALLSTVHLAEFDRYATVLEDVMYTLNNFITICYSPTHLPSASKTTLSSSEVKTETKVRECEDGEPGDRMEVDYSDDEEVEIKVEKGKDKAQEDNVENEENVFQNATTDSSSPSAAVPLRQPCSPSKDCVEVLFMALENSKILVRIAARSCLLKIIRFAQQSTPQSKLERETETNTETKTTTEANIDAETTQLTSVPSPFDLIVPEILEYFSRPLDVSMITTQTLGHVSKLSFLLAHLPSTLTLDHDMLVHTTDQLMAASRYLDDSVAKSYPPFHQSLLNSSSTVVSDPANNTKISHNFNISDEDVMAACYEENIDIVISTYPLATNLGIELRSQMINLLGAIFACPNVSKDLSLEMHYMPFRERCIALLHQSLSLKWVQLIERAHIKMINISNSCTIVFKDIYDNMKPILPLFEDIRNLTLPKLKTLEAMIRIVRNKSYLQLSWKLLDQLKHWTNPSRIMQLNLWPAGEEVMIAAAIINIFSILPWDDANAASAQSGASSRSLNKTANEVHSEALHPPPVMEKNSHTPESAIPPLLLQSAAKMNPNNITYMNNINKNINNMPPDGMVRAGPPLNLTGKDTGVSPPIMRSSSTGSTSGSSLGGGSRSGSGSAQTNFPIFFNRLIDILMRIERVRCQYQCSQTVESPVLIALTRLLEAFPGKALDYFVESVNLSRPDVIHLLLDLFPLSSRCPKFMNLLLSAKGSLALKQCIDAYCDSVRARNDAENNVRTHGNAGPVRGNCGNASSDGLLFSSVIQARLAEVKSKATAQPHPNSMEGTEQKVTSVPGAGAGAGVCEKKTESSDSSSSCNGEAAAPSASTLLSTAPTSSTAFSSPPLSSQNVVKMEGASAGASDGASVVGGQVYPSQQPAQLQPVQQQSQLQPPMRTSTSSPSPSVMSTDVLSSPLLLSSYQMQPPGHMSMLLDSNNKNRLPPSNLLPPGTSTNTNSANFHSINNNNPSGGVGMPKYIQRSVSNGHSPAQHPQTTYSVLTEDSIRRAAANTIRVVQQLCILQPNFMADNPALLKSLRVMLILSINKNNFSVTGGSRDPGPLKSSPKTCTDEELRATADTIDSKFQEHFEIKTICESLLDYYRRNTSDILILFDLMPVLCAPCTLDFSFLLQFFKMELSTLLNFQLKRDTLRAFLSLCDVRTVCGELKVKTLQVMIIPLLLQLFRDNNHADVKKHVLDLKTIKLIMKNAFFSGEVMSGLLSSAPPIHPPPLGSSPPESKSADSLGEPMKIELLKVATLLIEHCAKELIDNRKDLIKFAWNHLKTEDVTTKHWAYVNVCRFISAYDTPPKIILQVYVALLRTYQIEHRELITMALDTLVPALPKRLRYEDFVKAMKWTKKIVFEEGHSLPQLIHVWNLIVRHASLFYPFRSHFVPQMVSTISRLGLPPNCPVEHRHVALGCAEVLVGWEFIRHKRIEKRISDSFVREVEREDRERTKEEGTGGGGDMDVEKDAGMDVSVGVEEDKNKNTDTDTDTDTAIKKEGMAATTTGSAATSSTSTSSSTIISSGVVKINEKDDEFALHPSMVQMLVNFLVRLGLYSADNRDRAINKLTGKCISLYAKLVTIVSMRGIKVIYFERLFHTFVDNYNDAAMIGKNGYGNNADKAAAAALALANKMNNRAAANAAIAMMKNNKKPGDKHSVPPAPKAGSSSGDGKSGTSNNISEKIFCTFLQFLTASLDSLDPKDSLFFDNIMLVKQIISPFFHSEHMMKPVLGDLFRKLILKSIRIFSLQKTPEEVKKSGFFRELSVNIDQVITKDYHEVESEAAAAALAANSFNRKKSDGSKGGSTGAIGKDNYAVCYWTLQFMHDICALTPSWIDNHGSSLNSMSVLFTTLHLNKVTKNCSKIDMSSAGRSSLSNGKGGLLVNACTTYPTSQIAITAETQQHPTYLADTVTRKVNPNIATHQNTLTSSLILLLKLLASALEMGYMRTQKDFILSIMHSLLEYSDDYTVWGLVVGYCCQWVARPGSPLSPFEQGILFNKITNVERFAMDVHAQCTILRVVSLVEVVSHKSNNGSLEGLKKLFGSKYSLPLGTDVSLVSNSMDCLALWSLGLMCSNARLRDLCAARLLKSRTYPLPQTTTASISGGASEVDKETRDMYKHFITIFDMNFKSFEKLYWPATFTPLLLSGVGVGAGAEVGSLTTLAICAKTPGALPAGTSMGKKEEGWEESDCMHVEVKASHSYYSFLHSLQTSQQDGFKEENALILQSLKTLPLVNPVAGDSFWQQCFKQVWQEASSSEQKFLTNVITRNIACHNYSKCFAWPEKLANASASALPHNVPQSIVQFMTSLEPRPEFPIAFLGAVGCGYRLWHAIGHAIEDRIEAPNALSEEEKEHAIRVLVATYSDAGDEEAILDVYRSFSKCPRTSAALDLAAYGFHTEAQGKLFKNMQECLGGGFTLEAGASSSLSATGSSGSVSVSGGSGMCEPEEPSLSPSEIEMEMWEERWMHSAKKLSQWEVLYDYSLKMGVDDVALESSSLLSHWSKVNRLLISMPSNNSSISIQIDRGGIIPNPEIKMYEAMINIVDSKPHRSEKVVLSAIETALHKWHSLPALVGGASSSNATHKWLLHTFHRVVELRESMNMIAEAMKSSLGGKGGLPPDLKGNLLTWRERLPEEWDDMHQWDSLLQWRVETFSLIKKSFHSRNLDESQLACAHDMPWTIIMHARAARKHGLSEVSSKILNKLKDISAMDVFDAYSKLREQILVFLPSSANLSATVPVSLTSQQFSGRGGDKQGRQLDQGLNIINGTNLEYFDADQKAELFRLKALFQLHLENLSSTTTGHAASQQSFAQAVQVCPAYAQGWLSWGELCFDTFNSNMNSSQDTTPTILRNANLDNALSTIICILKAVESNSELGRILLARVILLVTTVDDSSGTLATALVTHGAALPGWIWIPYLPTMLKALFRCISCRTQMASLLCTVAKAYPEAVVHQLMALDISQSNQIVDEILQRISSAVLATNSELLSSINWLTRHIERKFSSYRFAWLALTFLDDLLKKVLDDFSCRLEEVVPPRYLEILDAFLAAEVVITTDFSSSATASTKRRRGRPSNSSTSTSSSSVNANGHEGSQRTAGTAVPLLPSEDDLKRRFAKEFEGLSTAKKSKKIKLSKFLDLIKRWVSIFSTCTMIATGSCQRMSRYRYVQSQKGVIQPDMYMPDFPFCGRGIGGCGDSILSSIEIPGQYALSSCRFREPRPDLHVKLAKVLPRAKRVFLNGEVLKYQILMLGSDGQHVAYNVSLKSIYGASSSGNESLFGQCIGFVEWCLKQHALTRASDTCITHPATVALRRLQVPQEATLPGGGGSEGLLLPMDTLTLPPTTTSLTSGNSSIRSHCSGLGHGDEDEEASESGGGVYSLTRAVEREVSLAGLCYSQSTDTTSGSQHTAKFTSPIVQACTDAIQVRRDIESAFLDMVTDSSTEEELLACMSQCKKTAFATAGERSQSKLVLHDALRNHWSHLLRNNNGEVFYAMRKTISSQMGVLGAVAYLLQSAAPTAREHIISGHDGRVLAYNMKPRAGALATPPSNSSTTASNVGECNDDQVEVDTKTKADMSVETSATSIRDEVLCLRLTPAVVHALSPRVVYGTLKTALGNTAVAIEKQKSLIETIMTSYCLDGISRSFSAGSATDSLLEEQDSSHLIAKTYAASFVQRCARLAPRGDTNCETDTATQTDTSTGNCTSNSSNADKDRCSDSDGNKYPKLTGTDKAAERKCDALVMELITHSLVPLEHTTSVPAATSVDCPATSTATVSKCRSCSQATNIAWTPWI